MQLAQQRKWKEEYIERTVKSKRILTREMYGYDDNDDEEDDHSYVGNMSHISQKSRSSRRSRSNRNRSKSNTSRKGEMTIPIGQELLISNAEGMEISISNHLQKSGFDSSLIPTAERYDIGPPMKPIGLGYINNNNNNDDDGDSFNDDRSFAMDTVSSLNSTLYAASDDGMSFNKGFKVKSSQSVGSKKILPYQNAVKGNTKIERNTAIGAEQGEDSLHPPLYVSSVKKIRKKNKKKQQSTSAEDQGDDDLNVSLSNTVTSYLSDMDDNNGDIPMLRLTTRETDTLGSLTNDDTIDDELVERKLLGRTPGSHISVISPFNTSLSKSVNPMDKTELVSNTEFPTSIKPETVDGKENDIPWHKSRYRNIESRSAASKGVPRERPINPQMFPAGENGRSPQDEPPSLSNARSPTTLRRRRLQLYLSNADAEGEGDDMQQKSSPFPTASNSSLQYSPDDHDGVISQNGAKNDLHRQIDFETAGNSLRANSQMQEDDAKIDTFSVKSGKSATSGVSLKSGRSIRSARSGLSLKSGKSIKSGTSRSVTSGLSSLKSGKSMRSGRSALSYATIKSCLTVKPDSPEEMELIVKRKQRQMFLLHHALSCTHPHATDPDDESYVPCKEVNSCQALCILVKHVQTCTFTHRGDGQVCPIPGCKEYKKVWNHYRRCVLRTFTGKNTKKCRLCGDILGSKSREEYNYDEEASI